MVDLIDDGILVELEYGDMAFTGNGPEGEVQIGIERKAIGDLVNSIATGRLSGHQLPGLLSTYYKVYIIMEGMCRESTDGELEVYQHKKWMPLSRGKRKFAYRDIWSYLTTLEVFTGVVVRHTSNMVETANQISYLYHYWQKPWNKHRGHLQIHKVPPPAAILRPEKPSLIRRMASELPSVGWEMSLAVEKYFMTVGNMFVASEEDWREVEGFGKLTARKCWEVLHDYE